MSRWRLLGIFLLLGLAVWVYIYKAAPKMPDIEVPWRAAARAAHGEPLYQPTDGHFVFKYLPAYAVVAIPLGWLPLPAVKLLWYWIEIGLLVWLLALSTRLPLDRRKRAGLLVFFTVLVCGKFYAHELVLGQMNLLFAVVLTYAFLALKEGREARAGILVALAIIVKPYAVLFIPWLIARRQL